MEQEKELEVITTKVNDLMTAVTSIQVIDDTTNTKASQILGWIKGAKNQVEKTRKFFVDPLNKQVKAINDRFRPTSDNLSEAEKIINKKMLEYFTKKEAEVAEANKKLLAEQQAKQKEALELGMKEEPVMPIAKQEEPQNVKTSFGTSFIKKNWDFEVVDVNQVPREYLVLDEKLVRENIRIGLRVIPGLKIFEKSILAHRG